MNACMQATGTSTGTNPSHYENGEEGDEKQRGDQHKAQTRADESKHKYE